MKDPRNPSGEPRIENRIPVVANDPANRNPEMTIGQNNSESPVRVETRVSDPALSKNSSTTSAAEPLLMPHQKEPFNGDYFVAQEFLKLAEKFDIDRVIELGTCVGGTTKWLGENFDEVLTVEIEPSYQEWAKKRCEGIENINFILGSSVDVLGDILGNIGHGETLLFIDSHWGEHFPLLEELEIIKDSGLKPVIAIHDCKVPGEPLGFDSYKGVDICFEVIKYHLDYIYGADGYDYHYNSDKESTEIKRGLIFIYPKQS